MLKQITASLIYPEEEIGKKFWKRIYQEAGKQFGTTNIPVNTFNKVWIVPEKAVVYENAKAATAYVVESKLKVMLEQDYLSLEKHEGMRSKQVQVKGSNELGSQLIREVVIPELTKEVNENKNFAQLRQVYQSLILATWYKKKIKDSILSQVYADKNKVAGVNINNPHEKQEIQERYLQAFKKGVYNYIKEEKGELTNQIIPRKYFSGGMDFAMNATSLGMGQSIKYLGDPAQVLDQGLRSNVLIEICAVPVSENGDNVLISNDGNKLGVNNIQNIMALSPVRLQTYFIDRLVSAIGMLNPWGNQTAQTKNLKILTQWLNEATVDIDATHKAQQLLNSLKDRILSTNEFSESVRNDIVNLNIRVVDKYITSASIHYKDEPKIITVNKKWWESTSLANQFFILGHEIGHLWVIKDQTSQGYSNDSKQHSFEMKMETEIRCDLVGLLVARLMGIVYPYLEVNFRDEQFSFMDNLPLPSKMVNSSFYLSDNERIRFLTKLVGLTNAQLLGLINLPYDKTVRYVEPVDRVVGSRAQAAQMPLHLSPGGIDLTPANMQLKAQNKHGEIKFHLDPAMLKQFQNTLGFTPVIINIQPLNDLPGFLRLSNLSTSST